MTSLFIALFRLSVQGSIFFLFVFVIRQLLRFLGAPKILNTLLWYSVLFQFLCPLRIPIGTAFLNFSSINHTITITQTALANTTAKIATSNNITTITNHSIMPFFSTYQNPQPNMHYLLLFFAVLWLFGVCIFLFRGAAQYSFLRKNVQFAYLAQEEDYSYYTGTGISTPFILGIFKPRIYLPTTTNATEKAYIYHHEQAHLAHKDFLLKPLFYLALSLHWFNPLIWFAMREMSCDIESACDEAVLSHFDISIKVQYCTSLLRFAHAPHYATMPLCFGEGDFTKRIKDILNYKKPKFWAIVSGALLVMIVCIVCLLNPFSNASTSDSSASASNKVDAQLTKNDTPTPTTTPLTTPAPTSTVAPTATPSATDSSLPTAIAITSTPQETTDETDGSIVDNTLTLFWPVPDYTYVSRWTEPDVHDGIDIVAEKGTPIYAAANGTVIAAGYNAAGTGYGFSVIIDHGDETQTITAQTLYAHGSTVNVAVGDTVSQGDLIMTVGSSGRSTGNHLHFELFLSNTSISFTEDNSIFPLHN